MKKLILPVLCMVCVSGLSLMADDEEPFPPQAYPADRYDSIARRSPFVLPTATEIVEPVTKNWATDYCIVGVVSSGDESLILAKKISTNERIAIRTKENVQGIRLLGLHMSANPWDVSADIELGGETGTITYDQATLSSIPRSVAPGNPALKTQ